MATHSTDLLKAAAEPIRLRILNLLRRRPLCVSDLQAALQAPQSTVSRHLALLRHAELVEVQRRGPRTFYRLAPAHTPLLETFYELLRRACACDDILDADRERLEHKQRTKVK